jgi:membrane-associated phospholipid phosphatase
MKEITSELKAYLFPVLLFAISGALLLIILEKGDFFLWLNAKHTASLDPFFKYITWLGDGLFWAIVIVLLLLFRRQFGLLALGVNSIAALMVQGIKNLFNVPRPSKVYQDLDLNYVDGVELYKHLSFPSGHTAAAFTGCLLIAYLFRNRYISLACFIIAFLVGISRIYLAQHFLIDVYVGGLSGVMIGLIVIYLFKKMKYFEGVAG